MIKDVDLESRRISLSLRDAEGDPWQGVTERYTTGQIVQGMVEKKEKFGMFVRLEPGVVGLIPGSSLERPPAGNQTSSPDRLNPEDPIPVKIERIDEAQRRITLSAADAVRSEEWRSYSPVNERFGSLGEKLKQALEGKTNS
jgi:small subunit ribosomal protein S1